MSSINLDLDYFSHPKTVRLIGLLGRGSEVLPIRLWAYCGKYLAESGRLTGYSAQEIETAVGWWGEKERAVEAMLRVGFLEIDLEKNFQVHDWLEHAGHLAAFRERAKMAAKERWKIYASSNASSNARDGPKQSLLRLGKVKKSFEDKTELPKIVEKSLWEEFRKMRQRIRKPMTAHAEELLLKDLVKLEAAGQDATAVIEQSIKHSWQGLFPVKMNLDGRPTKTDQQRQKTKEFLERKLS